MSSASLLHILQARIGELATAIAPLAHQRVSRARFDNQLFHTRAVYFRDYLEETENTLQQLRHCVETHQHAQVAFLAERLVAQLAALQRERATESLRKNEPTPRLQENFYEKLATHQDFERRLLAMISDRENRHAALTQPSAQQTLQKEIVALEGRLQRCRQALVRIERQIECQERGLF